MKSIRAVLAIAAALAVASGCAASPPFGSGIDQSHLDRELRPQDDRLFLGWAQVWRNTTRDGALRERLLVAPHSPPEYRVNGVVQNIPAFHEAFDMGPDDALHRPAEDRLALW